jgi:hypothetical protein
MHQIENYTFTDQTKWDANQSETVDFITFKNNQGYCTLQNLNWDGDAVLQYRMEHVKDRALEPLDYRGGTRLLVGRYCLLDPHGACQACQVVKINANGTVKLRIVKSQELIDKNISIKRLKFIERYGVSVYDKRNEPSELQNGKFEWKCEIVTKDRRLVNLI